MRGNVSCIYDEGLNNKLALYRMFSEEVGFKKYSHGASHVESRLLFKFRSGTRRLMKSWVGIEGGKGKFNVPCVVLSVRVLYCYTCVVGIPCLK